MKGKLCLENGECFTGTLYTNENSSISEGEVVFYTGMTGYQEVITDPSYKGQIIVFTYPLIGNYGINEFDFESVKPHVSGVVVYETKESFSHYQGIHSLKEYLIKWNIPLLTHVDTRAVVKRIRTEGTMLGRISDDNVSNPLTHSFENNEVANVSTREFTTYGTGNTHIVLIDFGHKKSILNSVLKRNCKVTVVPFNTSFEKIEALNPTGVILSNGPGDPKSLANQFENLKNIIGKYPTLGICLGHQLIALSLGANTKKLKFGHRGANQPVLDIQTNKIYITSQNHSYVVDESSLENTGLQLRFTNNNDGSVEGMSHEKLPVLSVQFHPEAHPGPIESNWIFDEFITHYCAVRREKLYA